MSTMNRDMALKELGASGSIDVRSLINSAPDFGGTPGKAPDDLAARRAGSGA